MTAPTVAPYADRRPANCVDAVTILDQPAAVALCRCEACHRPVPTGRLVGGRGQKCARKAGLTPTQAPRIPRLRRPGQDGPDLLDLLVETEMLTL